MAFVAVQTSFEGFHANTFERAKEVMNKYSLMIPVGQSGTTSKSSALMARYRTGGTPWTIIIDRTGIVRYNNYHIQPESAVELINRLIEEPPKRPSHSSRS